MSSPNDIINSFRAISLKGMDAVALMNRVDTKYLASRTDALSILQSLSGHYDVLEIGNRRLFQYRTTYFDTTDRYMLNEHLRGKMNRVKVRVREYVGTDTVFLEVKLKTNKGRTVKSRISKISAVDSLNKEEADFLTRKSAIEAEALAPAIEISFSRATLVSTEFKERITFDFNLSFLTKARKHSVDNLVIIEMKRDSESAPGTPVRTVLKEHSVRPSSMSKYCMGMILLKETERYNRYKPKLLKLNKLSSNGNIR